MRGAAPSAQEMTAMCRRLGFVIVKMHEVVMSSLIAAQKHELAEAWNDIVKPVADFLLHVDFASEVRETRDTIPEGDDDETV